MTAAMAEQVPLPAAAASDLSVDLAAVAANTRLLAERAEGALMAVVKADGFGHGAVDVARTALSHGATWLGVTAIAEALPLRRAGLRAPVLSWLNPVGSDFGAALAADIDLAVPSAEHLRAVLLAASRSHRTARVHLHLDTGMGRDGCEPSAWRALCAAARRGEARGLLDVVGVMGHLACADQPAHPANAEAARIFDDGVTQARQLGLRPQVCHLAATAATLTAPGLHHDLVRVGAGLVGIDPSGSTALSPALTLTAPVISVRTVPAGTGVGYGHSWVAPAETRLALLAVGYADGLPRVASGHAQVWLAGRRRPVVGRISMDQVVLDLGSGADAAHVVPGEVATVLGPGTQGEPTVEEWATWSQTLPHEIVTGLGQRPRRTHQPALAPLRSLP